MAQYKISNEKYGETTYFAEDQRAEIVNGIIESMFTADEVYREYERRCETLGEYEEPEFTPADIKQEWIDKLLYEDIEELDCDNHRIIMDNAGGIILQFGEWAHYYNGMEYQVARDIAAWIENRETTDWEGHEIEALDIDTDTPYGYIVIEIGDDDSIRSLIREMLEHSKWDRLATAMMAHLD